MLEFTRIRIGTGPRLKISPPGPGASVAFMIAGARNHLPANRSLAFRFEVTL